MYVAHISEDGREQSVKQHCENVAARAADNAKIIGLENTCYLIGLLHDMGKNQKISDDYQRAAAAGKYAKRGAVHHSKAGGRYLYENFCSSANDMIISKLAAVAISSHHGLYDVITPLGENRFFEKMHSEEKCDYAECVNNMKIIGITKPIIDNYFEKSKKEIVEKLRIITSIDKDNALFYTSLFQRLVTSFLICADHEDTAQFMTDSIISDVMCNKELWKKLINNYNERIGGFTADTPINKSRIAISNLCRDFANNESGIYRLDVPTGSGKTLSSLRFALNHCHIHDKSRIFYIAPYMSILEQNSDIIRTYINDDSVVLEHHSDVIRDTDDEEKNTKYAYMTGNWRSPIVVTTFVQFLNTIFSAKISSVKRMQALCNSVIIIDEVQSVPIRCTHLFNLALNFLCKVCNCTILLCTATQPNLEQLKRPVLLSSPADMVSYNEMLFKPFDRVKINYEHNSPPLSLENAPNKVFQLASLHNNALIIVNTKKAALEIYKGIAELNDQLAQDEKYEVYHLSTNMCPQNRSDILSKIKADNNKAILVSTQLIEAGVDISFECVIRSATGLSGIAQAAGRCNRNGEASFGQVYIVNINEYFGNLKELKNAKAKFLEFADAFYADKSRFDNDMLSQKSVEFYYKLYYGSLPSSLLDYEVEDTTYSLYDIFGKNESGVNAAKTVNNSLPLLNGAYKTTGREFEVISGNTIGIVVPYKKGKELKTAMGSDIPPEEFFKLLKKAQKYTVNVFEHQLKSLEKGKLIYPLGDSGAFALNDGYYDENIGITTDKNNSELLLY